MYYIYLLSEPETLIPKYIGYSKDPKNRYSNHLCVSKSKSLKTSWIKSLKSRGLKPHLSILDSCENFDCINNLEIEWIQKFKEKGFILKNGTLGGGGKRETPTKKETKELISKVLKEKYKNESHKLKGVKWSEERKKEKSKQVKGKKANCSFLGKKHVNIRKKVACYKDNLFVKLYDSVLECSIDLNVNPGTISNICLGKGISHQNYKFRYLTNNKIEKFADKYYELPFINFTENNRKKLNKEQVLNIRKRLKLGQKIAEIAKLYNIHIESIRDIKNRKTWKQI